MKFTEPVREAEFIRRYKRFFADVRFDDRVVVSHVANTGSLKTCLFEGAPCIITESNSPTRKLKATLQFLKAPTSWVGVNTVWPNALVYEAWERKLFQEWADYHAAKPEYKLNKETRLDLVLARDQATLEAGRGLHFVEVKNVTYAVNGCAYFPDAVTTRGQKHLRELMRIKREGHEAEIVFVIQRTDCTRFAPADDIDADYGRLLREAHAAGVRVRAHACDIDPQAGITLRAEPVELAL